MLSGPIRGVALQGLVASVPQRSEGLEELGARFGRDTAARIAKATGIESRRIAGDSLCTSDLAAAAATRLLHDLEWAPDSVDLLLVGDTTSRLLSPDDRNVAPLFGDAAAAAALVFDPQTVADDPGMVFDLGSDGSGAPYLTVPAGGFRQPSTEATRQRRDDGKGSRRGDEDLFMDGTQVFAFTLREIPGSLERVVARMGWQIADVDHFVLHQANAMMNRRLGGKIGARDEQVVIDLREFGNTSSASVALAMAHALRQPLLTTPQRLVLSGFGVGWSWASAALTQQPLKTCEVIEVEEA